MYSGKVKKKTTHSYDADHYLQCKDIEKKADTLRNNTIFCFFQSFFFPTACALIFLFNGNVIFFGLTISTGHIRIKSTFFFHHHFETYGHNLKYQASNARAFEKFGLCINRVTHNWFTLKTDTHIERFHRVNTSMKNQTKTTSR